MRVCRLFATACLVGLNIFDASAFAASASSSSAASLVECPGADVGTKSQTVPGSQKLSVEFVNEHQKPVALYWVNDKGSEVFMEEVASGERRTFTTYPGHAWRAKAFDSSSSSPEGGNTNDDDESNMVTVTDMIVPSDAKAPDVGVFGFIVPKCGTPSQGALPVETFGAGELEGVLTGRFPECAAREFLGSSVAPGLYVVCANGETGEVAVATSKEEDFVVMQVPEDVRQSPAALRQALERTLELQDPWIRSFMGRRLERSYHRPFWALYTPNGRYQMTSWDHMIPNEVNPTGTGLLMEGGAFIWPGVEIGHKFTVDDVQGRSGGNVTLETLSLIPLVFSISGLFEDWECDHLIKIASPHIAPSVVNLMDHDLGKKDTEWRTSKTHFIGRGQDDIVKDLERRVRDVTNIPIANGEGAQILKYERNQHYHTHHDFFDPRQYSKSARTLEMTEYGASNRMATVFWYLSTVPEGGETNFPRAGGAARPTRSDKCYTGLKVKPVKGRVIIFYDMLHNGITDEYSLHAGCDVECEDCVKWSANKWLWNKDQGGRGWGGNQADKRKDSHKWPSDEEIEELRKRRAHDDL